MGFWPWKVKKMDGCPGPVGRSRRDVFRKGGNEEMRQKK